MIWNIIRQELVLFSPRHKRIRYFYEENHLSQEADGENMKNAEFYRYRKQAQEILKSFRKVLKFPPGAEVILCNVKNCEKKVYKVKLALDPKVTDVFIDFLSYWQDCLELEDWSKKSLPYQVLDDLNKQIGNRPNSVVVHTLTFSANESTLTTLLSTLPILPHWDIAGAFSPHSDKSKKDKMTLLSSMRRYVRPVYAAQIKIMKKSSLPQKSKSRKFLGYPVRLRVSFRETDSDNSLPTYTAEGDFYDYCHEPKNNEIALYKVYGNVMDAINTALLRGKEKGEEKEKEIFYIAYPITTSSGRLHFWHIWLEPGKAQGNATLENLWASWWPLHQQYLEWQTLHQAFATELEQLDIAYTQAGILKEISKSKEKASADKLVCEFGHLLFPAECFCTKDSVWRYRDYPLKTIVKRKSTINIGSKWDNGESGLKPRNENDAWCIECMQTPLSQSRSIIFRAEALEDKRSNHQDLMNLRYQRLVDQQEFLVNKLIGAESHRRDEIARETREIKTKLQLLLLEKFADQDLLNQILDKIEKCDFKHIKILGDTDGITNPNDNNKCLTCAQELAEFLFEDNHKDNFRDLISGGLHAAISQILELDHVKLFSHESEDYPDLAECYPHSKIQEGILKQLSILDKYLESTVLKEATEGRLKLIKEKLCEWKKHAEQQQLPNCCQEYADNLAKLRIKGISSFNLNRKNDKGPGAKMMGGILSFDEDRITSDGDLHLSLDEESILGKDSKFAEIVNLITNNKHDAFYFVFALRKQKEDLEQWKYCMYRNYLVISYHSTHEPQESNAIKFFANHLDSLGGRLFIATNTAAAAKDTKWNQYARGNWSEVSSDKMNVIRPDHKKDDWDNCFKNLNNKVLLIAFDGYYMRDHK